ncbi:unnamed protein product [Caenorhabditis angaria]|uniref:GSKIP domain-containing protein n=1 Tax=Caenorhabditis angaria TaxID=860376 RepID=A0A9P1IWL6_9PELO|nr:unnamed protein product [Caenorhabditis angaria]
MPSKFHVRISKMSNCSCIIRCSCSTIKETIDAAPEYLKKDAIRWNSAAQLYEEITEHRKAKKNYGKCKSQHHSPEHSPTRFSNHHRRFSHNQILFGGSLLEIRSATQRVEGVLPYRNRSASLFAESQFAPKMLRTEPIPCLRCGNVGSPTGSVPMSLHKVSSINRSAGTNPASRGGESSLELEAIAAVHELSFAVQSISVSEMLPRTPDLIFVNVTTIETQPYCLELTLKGWRITSLRSDCMVGDFTRFELFTKYYDSLYALMDDISPGYRERFGEKLTQRLRLLECGEDDIIAPCGSLQSPPLSTTDSHYSSNDSLPTCTPVSTPLIDPKFEKPFFN